MRAALILALCASPQIAFAGYAKQETEFHLDAPAAKVCDWIERHPQSLEAAAGATVVAQRDDNVKLDMSDDYGRRYIFWVKRVAERARYREEFVRPVRGGITSEQTEIVVVANESGGCDVTIRMTATIDDLANVKIAVGCRRAIKGMRALVERTFDSQTQ
jgi:hypothetical protein